MRDLKYTVTFRDFQFIQTHMARRLFARNKSAYIRGFIGIVLCACLLTLAIIFNLEPYRAAALLGGSIPYPLSFYLVLILCLIGALLCLIPAIATRSKMLRMQVSDDGPFLGDTLLRVEDDGLILERPTVRSKYSWAAFQGVEIAKGRIILPLDNGIGLVIPRDAFESESELHEFSAMVLRHIESRG